MAGREEAENNKREKGNNKTDRSLVHFYTDTQYSH
jgi:hypothetical protein